MSYGDYLNGKSVVIVGPAGYVDGCWQGKEIDSCDVVVRVNKALPIPGRMVEHIGKRCDVLYNAMDEGASVSPVDGSFDPEITRLPSVQPFGEIVPVWVSCGVSWICAVTGNDARVVKFEGVNKGRLKLRRVDREVSIRLMRKYRTFFNTGVVAIADLSSTSLASLMIIGFSFYCDGVYEEYRTGVNVLSKEELEQHWKKTSNMHHSQEPQRRYVRDLLKSDGRVRVDPVVADCLRGDV